jgi:hypothetical protein
LRVARETKRGTLNLYLPRDEAMTSEDEFDSLSVPDIDEDLWSELQTSFVCGSRLPPPSSAPQLDVSLEKSSEEVEQDKGESQPVIGTQSTFSDGVSFFDSFTESQLALLDQLLASPQTPVQASEPCHSSEGSPEFDIEDIDNMPHTRKSLMQLFRPSGKLTVTDLVHPIWWAMRPFVERNILYISFLTVGVS